MEKSRVFVFLLDSLGIGASKDAGADRGADTLGAIARACEQGKADQDGLRQGPLVIPHLMRWGLGAAYHQSTGSHLPVSQPGQIEGVYGYAVEQSVGKDTPSGHWELMGVPILDPWTIFEDRPSCLPEGFIASLIEEAKLPGVLGNCRASGTTIIAELGEEHISTGKPIVYTSGDSVVQIAAHEDSFGLEALYHLCEVARRLIDPYNVGRVIARPFVGEASEQFVRTGNRRDWATPPPAPTLFDHLVESGRQVIAIGKTADIFAHRGVSESIKAEGIEGLFAATVEAAERAQPGSLTFTNFVDFDSHFGHRRNVPGYADALERFDHLIPEFESIMRPNDIAVMTADHGCDPTWPGSDHTREHIPVVLWGPKLGTMSVGERSTFADVGQTLASYLRVKPLAVGESLLG